MSDNIPQQLSISTLSTDLTVHILSLLPIPTLLRSAAVCKSWHSIISDRTFPLKKQPPWFFLLGLHNISSKNNQSFAFDPSSNSWFVLPNSVVDSESQRSTSFDFQGSNGFYFTTTPHFSYTPILKTTPPRVTSPLNFARIYPLIGVFNDENNRSKFIIVGGVSFIGNLVDIEDRLAVEIYDPDFDTWELCPPPSDFMSGNSAKLSSAMFKHKFYVFGIYSFLLSAFDLHKREWSEVHTLRPPGVIFSFLIACENHLVLAGLCHNSAQHAGGATFNLWKLDEVTMMFTNIGSMPQSLLCGLVDGEDDDNCNKYASLKCVGLGNLIYVFNEEYHKNYPACVCEISSETGECSWRRLPELPYPVNKFHKVISFCSEVSIRNLL